MNSITIKIVVIFLLAVNVLEAQTQLVYDLKVGDTFKVNQIADQDIVQDMNGQKHEMKNLLESDFTFIVEHVNDSIFDIRFKFDRFKMISTSNLMGEIISVNTEDKTISDKIESKIFAELVNVDLHMKMRTSGKIKSIEGSENLINKMVNAVENLDDFTKEVMKESMKGEFSNESLAKSFEQMTYIYPDTPVTIGDTWTNNFDGDLSSKNIWTLNSIIDDSITITGNSEVSFATIDDGVKMDLDGDMTSNLITSKTTGFIKTMTTSSTVKGNSIMQKMNDIKVPTTIVSNVTYKIEKHVQ